MNALTLTTRHEDQTVALGHRLGELASVGDVFLLHGELGAGKTCLIRGIAEGLGVSGRAFSPSFVLVRQYRGRLTLYHMDFYRLERPEEVEDLGVEEYLYGDGVCAIEWAERASGLLPHACLEISLYYVSAEEQARTIKFAAYGERYTSLLQELSSVAAQQ
ncbi:MAG: tRNA (adenosine(37)-N6)-threonylcarbamoyltransferase complex ATPase subunit type 1 TsaE [Dehalococcoidia bacterium]|nr:tRNA (adenosine(37)-N6)-threonylcarbamoyltransferase complex ATPase subunit type 1 TsaE [Dehalococcoidia bacterium]